MCPHITPHGLRWIQREDWESEEEPGYKCFKWKLERLSFSVSLMEGDWAHPFCDELWETPEYCINSSQTHISSLGACLHGSTQKGESGGAKIGIEWAPFQEDAKKSTKFHCTKAWFIFARCSVSLGLCNGVWVYVFQCNPKWLLLNGKLHSEMTPFSIDICGKGK